jgi:myo-inositol-1(or 4)-monophosphatase
MADTPSAQELLALAVRAAAGGAALAQDAREQAITQVGTKSTDTDVVTAGDEAVERYIITELTSARPGDAVLSEESGVIAGAVGAAHDSPVRWILDPIDGTVNYLYGVPYYAVSLAAEVDGVVVAAVVNNPATGEQWTALRGGGAYRGAYGSGQRLSGSTETDLGHALIATGFGYHPARRRHQAAVLAGLAERIRDIRRFGSAALDLCLAAEGTVDGYYEAGLNAWDMAAGVLIATEAGLVVTDVDGGPPTMSLLVAAPPAIHGRLLSVLRDLDAADGP